MMQSTTQEIGTLVDKLAAKLSVPAAHLWSVLVKQARAEAIADVVWASVFVVALVPIIYWTQKAYRALASDSYGDDGWAVPVSVVGSAVGLILMVLTGMCINEAILYFVNPEYFAISKLLTPLK